MSSGEIMKGRRGSRAELPFDVVQIILLELPAEDVFRCKLLSKAYYNLITNPDFINEHLRHQQSRNMSIAVMVKAHNSEYHTLKLLRPHNSTPAEGNFVYKPPSRHPHLNHWIELVGSCNGLLCLQLINRTSVVCRSHTLWNHITREIFEIPESKFRDLQGLPNSNTVGFGSCCGGTDYKLVMICGSFSARIWSMSRNQWKDNGFVLPGLLFPKKHIIRRPGLFIRGSLYWLAHAKKESSGPRNISNGILVSFDTNTDRFREVNLPDDSVFWEGGHELAMNDFMGNLAMFAPSYVSNSETIWYDVWVMTTDEEEDHENSLSVSWTKKFSIGPLRRYIDELTGASIDGKFMIGNLFSFEYHFYNPHLNKKLETGSTHGENSYFCSMPWCFTGSLVLIKQHLEKGHSSTRKRKRKEAATVKNPAASVLGKDKN